MELHSSWKGFIQLSLVTIPVKAITAHETEREVQLHQLHKDCNQRINYKKMSPGTKKYIISRRENYRT